MNGERRRYLRGASIGLAAAAVGLFAAGTPAHAGEVVGQVMKVAGSAQIQRAGATLPAKQGAEVELHDQVTTQPDSSAILGFPDGSSLALAASTSVAIEDAASVGGKIVPSRVTLLSGKLHTIVPDKATGATRSFEVDTPNTHTAPLN